MKKLAKSVLSLTLCLVMVLTALSPAAGIVTASAANSGKCGEKLTWSLKGSTLTISGTGKMKDYDSSSDVPWYSYNSSIVKVIVENGVTSIGDYAFYKCTELTSVTIGTGIKSIGSSAFRGCSSLTSIDIPAGVTSIGECAFEHCTGLTGMEIPGSITSIGMYAFFRCTGITSIEIPQSVTSIGEGAFGHCESLESITVDEDNTVYNSRNDCNAIIETATNTLVAGCNNTVIPEGVTSIGDYVFASCTGLTDIEIPEGVTSIGNYAFNWCEGLTSIEIPEGVTSIGECAFEHCTGLTSTEIPALVTSIGDWAFALCPGLESIIVDAENTVYDSRNNCNAIIETETDALLFGCKNTVIPTGVTSVGEDAFWGCEGLTSIEIPASVTSIRDCAFNGCNGLTDVYYGGTETDKAKIKIGDYNEYLIDATWHCAYDDEKGSEEAIIVGNAQNNQMTYAYKTAVTFRANVPEGSSVQWYIDGEEAGTGATLSVPAKTKDYTVTVVVTDADGFKTFDEEKVTIKSSFIDMIIYFFRHLFNPAAYIVEQK